VPGILTCLLRAVEDLGGLEREGIFRLSGKQTEEESLISRYVTRMWVCGCLSETLTHYRACRRVCLWQVERRGLHHHQGDRSSRGGLRTEDLAHEPGGAPHTTHSQVLGIHLHPHHPGEYGS
jgi:hypothetical protein